VTAYSNQLTDFDNEYVWHCHILGHEEFDFMRPFIFHPTVNVPDAPGAVTVNGSTVTWTDPTPFGGQDSNGVPTAGLDANGNMVSSPKNEVGFKVQETVYTTVTTQAPILPLAVGRATQQYKPQVTQPTTHVTTVLANVPANTITWTDTTGKLVAASSTNTLVIDPVTKVKTTTLVVTTPEVVAFNSAGTATGNNLTTLGTLVNKVDTGATAGATAASNAAAAAATAATTAASAAATAAATAATTAATTAAANTAANSAVAAAAAGTPVSFAVSTDTLGVTGAISLTWFNNPSNVVAATGFTNVTGYTLTWSGYGTGSATVPAGATGATVTGLTSTQSYNFSLVANAPAGSSAAATITGATAP